MNSCFSSIQNCINRLQFWIIFNYWNYFPLKNQNVMTLSSMSQWNRIKGHLSYSAMLRLLTYMIISGKKMERKAGSRTSPENLSSHQQNLISCLTSGQGEPSDRPTAPVPCCTWKSHDREKKGGNKEENGSRNAPGTAADFFLSSTAISSKERDFALRNEMTRLRKLSPNNTYNPPNSPETSSAKNLSACPRWTGVIKYVYEFAYTLLKKV
jgi:hypothetical protein